MGVCGRSRRCVKGVEWGSALYSGICVLLWEVVWLFACDFVRVFWEAWGCAGLATMQWRVVGGVVRVGVCSASIGRC